MSCHYQLHERKLCTPTSQPLISTIKFLISRVFKSAENVWRTTIRRQYRPSQQVTHALQKILADVWLYLSQYFGWKHTAVLTVAKLICFYFVHLTWDFRNILVISVDKLTYGDSIIMMSKENGIKVLEIKSIYNSVKRVLCLFWQLNGPQNPSVGRWREFVARTVK